MNSDIRAFWTFSHSSKMIASKTSVYQRNAFPYRINVTMATLHYKTNARVILLIKHLHEEQKEQEEGGERRGRGEEEEEEEEEEEKEEEEKEEETLQCTILTFL